MTSCPHSEAQFEDYSKRYSPFAVVLDEHQVFSIMTFEDVGLGIDSDVLRGEIYEAISEGVAYEILNNSELNYTPHVDYNPHLCDPTNHQYCDGHHLYVAVWRGTAPDRWGYSLWSGCDEESQFAWNEVEAPFSPDLDLDALVEPLTQAIVTSLQSAEKTDCYRLSC